MSSIVFLEVDDDDLALVRREFPAATIFAATNQDPATREALQTAEIVCCFIYSTFDANTLSAMPALKLLCTRSVGCDHIDLALCAQRGITVCNVPDYGSHVIAEHVFALLLSTLRHIHLADARVEGGEFDYHGLRGIALKGKLLGIVGTGKIGSAVARIAHGFDMQILATDLCAKSELIEQFHVSYLPLSELLQRSDIVTLHLPATPDTTHIIDAEAFATIKPGAILINTARGALIDSATLLDALHSGRVAHALLDVLEHERNFAENKALIDHPNVVTTPHIAFYADDSMLNMYEESFASIHHWLANGDATHDSGHATDIPECPRP